MGKPVVITADSTFDFSPEMLEKYHVTSYPLSITLDDRVYRDGVDITPDDIYAQYREKKKLPKTSAVSPGEYKEFFEDFTKQGYAVVHINLSTGLSVTHNNALLAAQELEDVYPVDSLNLSTGIGLIVVRACEMRDSGMEAPAIVEELKKIIPLSRASFVLDTLEFLHKGGRCSGVAALGANLLKLKPCIEVVDGKMIVGKKYRGKLDAVLEQYTRDKLAGRDDIDLSRVFITHSGISEDIINHVKAVIHECCNFKEILVTRAGCTITSHCGPNTLGVLFMVKPE